MNDTVERGWCERGVEKGLHNDCTLVCLSLLKHQKQDPAANQSNNSSIGIGPSYCYSRDQDPRTTVSGSAKTFVIIIVVISKSVVLTHRCRINKCYKVNREVAKYPSCITCFSHFINCFHELRVKNRGLRY